MIDVNIIAVGKIKDKWMTEGLNEYAKRLSAYCNFKVVEIPEFRLPQNPSQAEIDNGIEKEEQLILKQLGKGKVVALCIEGKTMSSEKLAEFISACGQTASSIDFVIGGSFGLGKNVKQRADLRLSVSPMTFPHQLFRVLLAEQIYRGFSIIGGSKYHK